MKLPWPRFLERHVSQVFQVTVMAPGGTLCLSVPERPLSVFLYILLEQSRYSQSLTGCLVLDINLCTLKSSQTSLYPGNSNYISFLIRVYIVKLISFNKVVTFLVLLWPIQPAWFILGPVSKYRHLQHKPNHL